LETLGLGQDLMDKLTSTCNYWPLVLMTVFNVLMFMLACLIVW